MEDLGPAYRVVHLELVTEGPQVQPEPAMQYREGFAYGALCGEHLDKGGVLDAHPEGARQERHIGSAPKCR